MNGSVVCVASSSIAGVIRQRIGLATLRDIDDVWKTAVSAPVPLWRVSPIPKRLDDIPIVFQPLCRCISEVAIETQSWNLHLNSHREKRLDESWRRSTHLDDTSGVASTGSVKAAIELAKSEGREGGFRIRAAKGDQTGYCGGPNGKFDCSKRNNKLIGTIFRQQFGACNRGG